MTTDLTTLLAEADAVSAAATPDMRPSNCRFRRKDEQKPYPRSSCHGCGRTITTGLGKSCAVADGSIAASRDLIPRLVAACREQMAEIERLREDRRRLDYLDEANRRLNAKYGTSYKWKLIMNHNVNRLMLGAGKVDLNDMEANGLPSCREAIDAARSALQPAGKDTP